MYINVVGIKYHSEGSYLDHRGKITNSIGGIPGRISFDWSKRVYSSLIYAKYLLEHGMKERVHGMKFSTKVSRYRVVLRANENTHKSTEGTDRPWLIWTL
jgi:hypothetical protein